MKRAAVVLLNFNGLELLEKFMKLLKLSTPIIKTTSDNINCLLSFTIQKKIKRKFAMIIRG